MSYRDRLPLPTYGASRYPGDVGSIELPGGLVPGAPHTPSGGPRRMLNGAFGRLAPVPRESAPLPHPDMQGAVARGGMGDYADDLYRSGMVQATTPGMQDMIQEFLARSAGNRQANNLNWGINQQVGWIDDQGREIQAHYADRLKSSSNFIDKAVQSKWFPAIAPLTTIGLLTYAAGSAYDATGASRGDTSAAYAGGGSAQYKKPSYIATGMSGIGLAGVREADYDAKYSLTQQARALLANAKLVTAATAGNMRAQINGLNDALDEYTSWTAWPGDGFDSSQTVRSTIGAALTYVKRAEGSTGGDWQNVDDPRDVSVAAETASEFGSRVSSGQFATDFTDTAGDLLSRAGKKAKSWLPTCADLPGPLGWACENPGKTLVGAIAAAVAVYAGPTIIKSGKSWTRAVRS